MKQISIIIPVFNTSLYLEQCISSCLNQNIEINKYEIIIVDDGSTDNSASIIKEFENQHPNIVFLQKENGGVSSARNLGMSVAEGEYILFVDSDDTIKENTLSIIINELNTSRYEILILNSLIQSKKGTFKESYSFPEYLKGRDVTGEDLFFEKYQRGSVCGVVFSKTFLNVNDLRFSEFIRNGEDSLFMTFCFLYAIRIIHLNVNFYEVNVRKDSASRTWEFTKVKHLLTSLNVLDEYMNNNVLSNIQKAMIYIKAYGIISNALFYFFSLNQYAKYYEIREIIKGSSLYPLKTYDVSNFKYKIYLLNLSIDLFCLPFFLRQQYFNLKRIILT